MTSRTQSVKVLVAEHRWKQALKIASTFRLGLTREQQIVLQRAYQAYHHGLLIEQMKRDPEECKRAGIALLQELYGGTTSDR